MIGGGPMHFWKYWVTTTPDVDPSSLKFTATEEMRTVFWENVIRTKNLNNRDMYLVGLTSAYIFHRLQTGHGSYLPEVNTTHWLLWSATITFIYSCIYLFIYLCISKEIQEDWDLRLTFPPLPRPHCSDSVALWFHFHTEVEEVQNVQPHLIRVHKVLIQICLVTMYDSCAGLLLPPQQACVTCVAHLIISNCAPVTALTFLIIGGTFFFQEGFDIGTVDFPRKSAIDSQLLSGYSICAVEFKVKALLSFCRKHLHLIKLCRKGRILAFRRTGKSFEKLWYPLALWHLT